VAMAEARPQFSIAGIPVRIEWSFWIIAVFLGFDAREGWLLFAWVVIVLVSILVHEFGHAVALRIYHQKPRVVLHAFGGLTYGSAPHRTRTQSIIVSAAGPVTALLLLGVPAYLLHDGAWAGETYERYVIVHDVMWVNIGWSIVNLLPILPLDGGNIAASLVGVRTARFLSMGVAFAAATYFFQQENQFGGFFLMMFAIMNFASYQQEKSGATPTVPSQSAQVAAREVLRAPTTNTDPFALGTRALSEGHTAAGLDALAAAYAANPGALVRVLHMQTLLRSAEPRRW